MRDQLYNFLTGLIAVLLVVLAGVTPLLFWSITTDFYDMPKLALLVTSVIILLGLWVVSWVVRGRIEITKTPLDIPLIAFLIVVLVSTFFSTSKYSSIYGVFPEVHGSAVSWVTYILLYFIAVSNLRTVKRVKMLLCALYGGAFLISLISILSFFQIFLPFEMAQGVNFTPTGLSFSTTALLLLLLPLSLISTLTRNKFMPQIIALLLSVLFGAAVVLIGSIPVTVLMFLIFGITLFVARNHLSAGSLFLFSIPFIVSSLLLIFSHVSFSGNALKVLRNGFPQEIQLPLDISWKISATAFRDAPIVGTGPSTFLFNFTSYKPVEFNQLDYWNFSFSSAYNEFLQVLGTLGLLGLLSLIVFSFAIIVSAQKYLYQNSHAQHLLKEEGDDTHIILPALAVSGVAAVFLMLIHATTLVSTVTTLLLMAAFMVSQKQVREKTTKLSIGVSLSKSTNKRLDLLSVFVLVMFLAVATPVSGRIYNAIAADYYHRLALDFADTDGTKTYEYLQLAESLNPFIDLYRVDMAQTNFALANALAAQKGPTEDNPEGLMTDEDRLTIQTLITQAINEGRASVVLSPRSSRNWEVLALIYRNITGVADNALTFSIDAYGRAIQLDPLNPELRVSVGSIYYATENYDMAIRFFTDAVNLKPDYVNGYYNLAIALRDKGDLQNALLVADQAVRLLRQDFSSREFGLAPEEVRELRIQDFNTASDLLNEIRNILNIETEESSALQNPELRSIDVPELDSPPDTTVPPAVEGNFESDLSDPNEEDSSETVSDE